MWVLYKDSCEQAGIPAAAYTTFNAYWRRLIPCIVVMEPMSDLCWICQQNSMRPVNRPDSEKSEVGTTLSLQKTSQTQRLHRLSELLRPISLRQLRRGHIIGCSAKSARHYCTTSSKTGYSNHHPFPLCPMSKPMAVYFSLGTAGTIQS